MILFETLVNGLIQGCIYALFAASFTLIFGVMDIPNMAHAALFGGGAYMFFALYSQQGLPWPVALIAAIIAVAILSALIERYLLRPIYERDEQDYIFGVILLTLGLSRILEQVYRDVFGTETFYLNLPFLTENSFTVAGTNVSYMDVTIVVLAVVSFAFLYWLNNFTITGYGLRAIVQDRELAHMKGINVDRLFLIAFTLGGAMISVAGAVYGGKYQLTPEMGFDLLVKAFIIVILGGIGNIAGAGIAGLVLGVYEAFATVYLSSYFIFASEFAVLIAFFLLKAAALPEGHTSLSAFAGEKFREVASR